MPIGLILTGGSAKANVALAKRAEQAGIDAVFSVEFFNQHGYVVLGAIAQETRRLRIGTGIANSFTRSPVLHASAALDLDELSDGRMVLGIGSGTKRMNEEWYGVPFSRPAARTRELVRLLRALFSQRGFGFRFDGEFWKLRIPAYAFPEAAAIALARAVRYGEWRSRPVGEPARPEGLRRDEAAAIVATALPRSDGWLTPEETGQLLACYGLSFVGQRVVPDPTGAGSAAEELGGTVALKALVPGIVHKTELGAVRVGIPCPERARAIAAIDSPSSA